LGSTHLTFRDYKKQWQLGQFRTFLPPTWVSQQQPIQQCDQNRQKVFFLPWLWHQLYFLLTTPRAVSGRAIAQKTHDPLCQRLTGLAPLSRTTCAEYLNTLPTQTLVVVIKKIQALIKPLAKGQRRHKRGLFTFDASMFEATKKQWRWAAPNGDRQACQLHFQLELEQGVIWHWAFDSQTTSSNTCFAELAAKIPPHSLNAWDRGYTKLEVLIDLAKTERHWVSKFYRGFTWTPVTLRPLPPDRVTQRGQIILSDVEGWLGHRNQGGPILTRQITVKLPHSRKKEVYHTSDLTTDPIVLVEFYGDHWAIENLFRSVKRVLDLEAVISYSLTGILNWFLLHILLLLLLTLVALFTGSASILTNFKGLIQTWCQAIHRQLLEELGGTDRSS